MQIACVRGGASAQPARLSGMILTSPQRPLRRRASSAVRKEQCHMYRKFVCPLHASIVDEPLQWRRNAPDNAPVTGAVDQVPGDGTDLLLMAKGGKDDERARFATFSPSNDARGRHAEEVPQKGAGGCPTHRGPDIGRRRAPRHICDVGSSGCAPGPTSGPSLWRSRGACLTGGSKRREDVHLVLAFSESGLFRGGNVVFYNAAGAGPDTFRYPFPSRRRNDFG